MNTVQKLNQVITCVEERLTGTIDFDEIGRLAGLPAYDMQRLFSLIAEMPLSEYIRRRRMTLAGIELQTGREKVIDVAMKYGYESPVSFARAFRAFHGISPGEAKIKSATLRSFSRLFFHITAIEVMSPIAMDMQTVDGQEYAAAYFGEDDMSGWSTVYSKRKYWRLENAYEKFNRCTRTGQVLPYNNYPPIGIQIGQVFLVEYYRKDSEAVERKLYVADGTVWDYMPSTAEIRKNKEEDNALDY